MARHISIPLQYDRPLFVKMPFTSNGKKLKKGDEYHWDVMMVDREKISYLYAQGYIHHNLDLEQQTRGVIGDGLDELDLEQLHIIVEETNKKIEKKCATKTEYSRKKMKLTNSRDKQIGLIRQWRRTYQKDFEG